MYSHVSAILSLSTAIQMQVDSYNTERALRKIKRHTSDPMDVDRGASNTGVTQNSSVDRMERLKPVSEEGIANQSEDVEGETQLSGKRQTNKVNDVKNFIGGPSSW